jgi:hypothetical protein
MIARPVRAARLRHTVAGTATCVFVIISVTVLVSGAPAAWLLLGLGSVVAVAVTVVALAEGRFFEPLTIIAVVTLLFLARALDLFVNATDLQSYYPPPTGVAALEKLDGQEIAQFVTRVLQEPLSSALTRAIAVVTIFIILVVVGYSLPWGRRWGDLLSRAGSRLGPLNTPILVLICITLAAAGQITVMATLGGPVHIGQTAQYQTVYKSGVIYQVLIGFGMAAIVIWAAWMPPQSTRARVGLVFLTVEICLFFALTGSRTRVFMTLLLLAVVSHYLWRRWRLQYIAIGCVLLFAALGAILAIRQATYTKPLGRSLASAPAYIVHPHALLNDSHGGGFDDILMATSVIGSPHHYARRRGFQYGMGIVNAVRVYLPRFIDPHRPQSGDQEFRYLIFARRKGAGRPYTVIGDLWNDFGFPGVVIGSVLFGLLARALLGLLASPLQPGREYRVALYAIGLVILFTEATVTYSVTLGYIITLVLPFLIAIHLLGPATVRTRQMVAAARAPSGIR